MTGSRMGDLPPTLRELELEQPDQQALWEQAQESMADEKREQWEDE